MVNRGEINAKFDTNFEASRLRQDDECVKRIEASLAKIIATFQRCCTKLDVLIERVPKNYGLRETFQEQERRHVDTREDLNDAEDVVLIEDSNVICVNESTVQEVNHVDHEVKHEKKATVVVEHVDFILPNFVFASKAASNFVLVSMLFPQIVFKTHRLRQFCWTKIWFVIL